MLKVAWAEDDCVYFDAMTQLMAGLDIDLFITVSNGKQLLDHPRLAEAQVVLMDLEMPVMDGTSTTLLLKQQYPHIPVIVLSGHLEPGIVGRAMDAGADGFMDKTHDVQVLAQALKAATQGIFSITAEARTSWSIYMNELRSKFTSKEMECLKWLCTGMVQKQIAEHMNASPSTVKGYVESLFNKSGLHTATGLVAYAVRNKLVE